METGTEDNRLNGHAGLVRSVAWSPDGTHIASGSDDEIIVWSRAYNAYISLLYGLARKAEAQKTQIPLSTLEQPEWHQAYQDLERLEDPDISDLIKKSITIGS